MSIFMAVLYIPGMPAGLVSQECVLVGIAVILGAALGISAKAKYGAEFGKAEGLWYPVKQRKGAQTAA
jgi:hypothetical protein